MKICHMTSAHDSDDVRIFWKECSSLARAGYETYLVAPGDSREENGVHVIGAGPQPGSRWKRIFSFSGLVYRKARELDCDVYHFHDPELLPYGRRLARRGKKVIYDSHENAPVQISEKEYLPRWAARCISFVFRWYETFCIKGFEAVVTPCTFNGKNIFDGRARRTVFIENYPLMDEFASLEDIRPEEKITSDICYTGSVTEDNGLGYLTDAAADMGVSLLLAGTFFDDEFRKACLGKSDCIRYLGIVDRATIRRIYAGTRIGACLSLNEGQYYMCDSFGVKVHEYMLSGIPVLVSDSPFSRRMIDRYHFGIYVDPTDREALREAIQTLLSDPELRREFGENGRRAAVEKFNWSTQEKILLELYRELAG